MPIQIAIKRNADRTVQSITVQGHAENSGVCAFTSGVVNVARQLLGGTERQSGGGKYEVHLHRDHSEAQNAAKGIVQVFREMQYKVPDFVVVSDTTDGHTEHQDEKPRRKGRRLPSHD